MSSDSSSSLDIGEDRRTGRGESRHGLEVRVHQIRELRLVGEDVRQRPERRHQQPDERDDQEPLTLADPLAAASGAPLQCEAHTRRDCPCREERPERLAVADGDTERDQKREAEDT